jgi:RecA-family ATPase
MKPETLRAEDESPEIQPFSVEPASLMADRDAPPPRDWICPGLALPAARVITFLGNGGFGKTTIAEQLAIAVATDRPLWGMPVAGGPVLGVFCEDEQDEIDRKTRTIAHAEGIELGLLDNLYMLSRDGESNALCTFENDLIVLTDVYRSLDATVASIKPRITIIDTAADVFAGDFMSTPHVRQFIKVCLGGLCKRHDTAVLLLAHPSATAMSSGDGGGFSVAWNNSVRARIYLRRPKSDDAEAVADRRVLEIRKSNYGPTGGTIPLIYDAGRFILDPHPLDEGQSKARKAAKADTRLSIAVMRYFEEHAASGQVIAFGAVLQAVLRAAAVDCADDEKTRGKVRKQLQRALKDLVAEGLIRLSNVPRGYRIGGETTS